MFSSLRGNRKKPVVDTLGSGPLGYAGTLGRVGLKVELEGTRDCDCVVGSGAETCRDDCGLNGDAEGRDGSRGYADVLNGALPFCGLGEAGIVRSCFG